MNGDTPDGDAWRRLVDALRGHVNNDMDQWERWRIKDNMGNTVYIHLSYKPTAPEEVHADLDEKEGTQ